MLFVSIQCIILLVVASTAAADRLWIAPIQTESSSLSWDASPIQILDTTIVNWSDRRVATSDPGSDATISYDAVRVLHVMPEPLRAPEREFWNAVTADNFADVLKTFGAAIRSRPDPWRQQWMTVWTIRSAARLDRWPAAYKLIRRLDSRPLPPLVFAVLPAAWSGNDATVDVDRDALLIGDSPATQFVAAMRLLPIDPRQAIDALERLASDPNQSTLGTWSRFVLDVHGDNSLAETWPSHEAELDAMPMAVQDGPLDFLWHRVQKAGIDAPDLRLRHRYARVRPATP